MHISQNIPAQVLVLDDLGELFADVHGVHLDGLLLEVGTVEGNILQQFFENGVETARADVLGGFIHPRGEAGDLLQRVLGKGELDAFGIEQRLILLDQRVLGLLENADEIGLA